MMIPNAVGRIDAITEAIRDGDRERAFAMIEEECKRLDAKRHAIGEEARKADAAYHSVVTFGCDLTYDAKWHQARRDCGWKGDE